MLSCAVVGRPKQTKFYTAAASNSKDYLTRSHYNVVCATLTWCYS